MGFAKKPTQSMNTMADFIMDVLHATLMINVLSTSELNKAWVSYTPWPCEKNVFERIRLYVYMYVGPWIPKWTVK